MSSFSELVKRDQVTGSFQIDTAQIGSRVGKDAGLEDLSMLNLIPRAERAIDVVYASPDRMPYHGAEHPYDVLQRALKLIEKLEQSGEAVDLITVVCGALLHDAFMGLSPKQFGFETAEHQAAEFAYALALQHGVPEKKAAKLRDIIVSTNHGIDPESVEAKVLRAADLALLAADYPEFKDSTDKLREEARLKRGPAAELGWQDFLPGAYNYLSNYVGYMIALTADAYDDSGRSVFHSKFVGNVDQLISDVLPRGSVSRIGYYFDSPEALELATPTKRALQLVVVPESELKATVAKIHEKQRKTDFAFALPGSERALPIPDQTLDQLNVQDLTKMDIKECARVLKQGGVLRFRQGEISDTVKEELVELGFSDNVKSSDCAGYSQIMRKKAI